MSRNSSVSGISPRIRAGALLGIVCVIALGTVAWRRGQLPALPAAASADMAEVTVRNQDIALFEARVGADPYSAADRAKLASLYFQRSRETGDFADYRRAETNARASLALREQRNVGALMILASSLLAQHRFADALPVAARLSELEPDKPSARSLLGEIQLELGDYVAADRTFRSLRLYRYDLAVAPRYARWAEIHGRTAEAGELLQRSLQTAMSRGDLPREQVAWFYLRAGDFHMRHGDLRSAEHTLLSGLVIEPRDHRLSGMLAQVAAVRGDWKDVVAYGERAGERADYTTLSAMAHAHAQLGDMTTSQALHDRIERQAVETPEPFARQWTQYRLDNNVALMETVTLLGREVAERPDVLGWDMYGWGLYKLGRYAEARVASQRALATGVEDARYYFHAAAIERALGAADAADDFLDRARAINAEQVERLMER